ncbi:MAG: GNAT family N-acetyltransferase [Ktedonobacterales bacterium]
MLGHVAGGDAVTRDPSISARPFASDQEWALVQQLAAQCNAAEGLELKLTRGAPAREAENGAEPRAFLAYLPSEQGEPDLLVGYCALDRGGDGESELCGMVAPDQRRRGIGRALYTAALAACHAQGITRLLIICEEASASGRAFVATTGAQYDIGEHRMRLTQPDPLASFNADGLTLEPVQADDTVAIEALAQIRAAAFDEPLDAVRRHVLADMGSWQESLFLLRLAGDAGQPGEAVATAKIAFQDQDAGIYGFAVAPERQGQGWGRGALALLVQHLLAEGWTRIGLEVETTNSRAYALYTTSGFTITTTYGYYALTLG